MGGYYPQWTEKEVEYLLENYNKMKNKDLGEILGGRSAKAVCQMYSRLVGFNRDNRKNQKIKKLIVQIKECPDCKSTRINKLDDGYFCVNCLTEYDKYGNLLYY